jgi:intracellular septation protein A
MASYKGTKEKKNEYPSDFKIINGANTQFQRKLWRNTEFTFKAYLLLCALVNERG